MGLSYLLGDRQPQTGTAFGATGEAFEEVGENLRVNTRAVVLYFHPGVPVVSHYHPDAPRPAGGANGVGNQVPNQLLQAIGVAQDVRLGLGLEVDSGKPRHHRAGQLSQIDYVGVDRPLGLAAGQCQQVAHQPGQVASGALSGSQRVFVGRVLTQTV